MISSDDPTRLDDGACPRCGAPRPSPEAACPACAPTLEGAPAPGPDFSGPKRVAGYRVLRELGAGGMGTVFEAFDERMNRHVALKVLSRHHAASTAAGRRFEQEAWIAGRLDHPNIVKVHDRGTYEELAYYSMELVEGGSLHDVVHNMRRWGRDDALGLEFGSREYVAWAIGRVVEAARALDHAHRKGVVHRDVKPMNLLLDRERGALRIADFGLAIDADTTRMTTEGKMLGTLAYMAPEQVLGKRDRIGPATDVYALGVTLFELLTLELPYTGKTQQLYLNNVLTAEARRPRSINARVSSDLETVIRKALEKEPRHRYASAAAFADDLENVIHLRPIAARRPTVLTRSAKWIRRQPVHAGLIVALAVGIPMTALVGVRILQERAVERRARVETLLERTAWLHQVDRYEEVVETARDVLDLEPDNPVALRYVALGHALRFRDQLPEALRDSPRGVELRERAIAAMERLVAVAPNESSTHATYAYVLHFLGEEERSIAKRRQAEALRSDRPTEQELIVEARLALASEDYQVALDGFTELYHRQPDNSRVIVNLAEAYHGAGDDEKARENYRLALAANRDLVLGRIDLGLLETDRGELEEGERFLRGALEREPGNAIAHEILAHNLILQGKRERDRGDDERARELFGEAERAARRSLELNPDQVWGAVNLAVVLLEQNRMFDAPRPELLKAAVAQLEAVVARWDEMPAGDTGRMYALALVNRCDALLQLRAYQRALPACFEVTAAIPDDPIGFYNLAGAYALLGLDDDALAALERNVELGDSDWRYLDSDAWFAELRDDPRYRELIRRMKAMENESASRSSIR